MLTALSIPAALATAGVALWLRDQVRDRQARARIAELAAREYRLARAKADARDLAARLQEDREVAELDDWPVLDDLEVLYRRPARVHA